MKIYNYDQITGEFLTESTPNIDPVETEIQGKNVYLIPANATKLEAPTVKVNEVAVFDGEKWEIKADYRGQKVFNKQTQVEEEVAEIGEIAKNFTKVAPQNQYQIWSEDQNGWVIDDSKRDELIRLNRDKINADTKSKIINNFTFNKVEFKLTAENQRNFDNEYNIHEGLSYPHKIKGINQYLIFKNKEEYKQFYFVKLAHVRSCLENGWSKKDKLANLSTEQLIIKLGEK